MPGDGDRASHTGKRARLGSGGLADQSLRAIWDFSPSPPLLSEFLAGDGKQRRLED